MNYSKKTEGEKRSLKRESDERHAGFKKSKSPTQKRIEHLARMKKARKG
jgi:hypothetical protein